jgi:hypothetical protein
MKFQWELNLWLTLISAIFKATEESHLILHGIYNTELFSLFKDGRFFVSILCLSIYWHHHLL